MLTDVKRNVEDTFLVHIHISYFFFSHCCGPISYQEQVKGGSVHLGSRLEGTVHHGGEATAAGGQGNRSFLLVCSLEVERDECRALLVAAFHPIQNSAGHVRVGLPPSVIALCKRPPQGPT